MFDYRRVYVYIYIHVCASRVKKAAQVTFSSFQLLSDSQSHCCRQILVPRYPASWPDIPPVRTRDLERNFYKQCKMVMLVLVPDGDDGGNIPKSLCSNCLALIECCKSFELSCI